MNESVAQPRNGNDGTREYWVDGGCANHDASGRRREAYGSWSDDVNVRRFNFPDAKTSNESEYMALIQLLSTLPDGAAPTIHTDSKLLTGQLTRGWGVKAENLKPLHKRAKELMRLTRARLTWVPRQQILAKLGH
ncbi:MAG: RNase H family protein [Acidobacteriota bacterium]